MRFTRILMQTFSMCAGSPAAPAGSAPPENAAVSLKPSRKGLLTARRAERRVLVVTGHECDRTGVRSWVLNSAPLSALARCFQRRCSSLQPKGPAGLCATLSAAALWLRSRHGACMRVKPVWLGSSSLKVSAGGQARAVVSCQVETHKVSGLACISTEEVQNERTRALAAVRWKETRNLLLRAQRMLFQYK